MFYNNPYINQYGQFTQLPFFPPFGQQQVIDRGTTLKNRRELRVRFNRNFRTEPVVVISPYWQGQNNQVAFVDTISDITRSGFTVISDNMANNYYVNWIAIGN